MIGNFLVLATEEGGFGLNLDILETNLINLALLLGILFYFGSKALGSTLGKRREDIATAIEEAEQRLKKASSDLAEEQQKLTQSQAEAERIRQGAQERAKATKEAILSQSTKDVERMKEVAVQDLNSEQERVIAELRQRVTAMALEKVESRLPSILNDEAQHKLIDRCIAQLGGN